MFRSINSSAGLPGLGADVKGYSRGLGICLGPPDVYQSSPAFSKLHVAPGEGRGLRAPQEAIPEDGEQRQVHPGPQESPLCRFLLLPVSQRESCVAAVALTAARAAAVRGFACLAARPWDRAMPFKTLRTSSLSVESGRPVVLWMAAMAARWSRTVVTDRWRPSTRWQR